MCCFLPASFARGYSERLVFALWQVWLKRCNRISLNHDTKDNEKRGTIKKKKEPATFRSRETERVWQLAGVGKAFTPKRGESKGEASNLFGNKTPKRSTTSWTHDSQRLAPEADQVKSPTSSGFLKRCEKESPNLHRHIVGSCAALQGLGGAFFPPCKCFQVNSRHGDFSASRGKHYRTAPAPCKEANKA